MPRLSLWYDNARRGNDFKFIDRTVSEYFFASGTTIFVHKFVGPGNNTGDTNDGSTGGSSGSDTLDDGSGIYRPKTKPNQYTGLYPETPWLEEGPGFGEIIGGGSLGGSGSGASGTGGASGIGAQIQDVLFLETRNRKYDPNVYEMRMCYQIQDSDFDLTQFGLMNNEMTYGEVHLNDMIAVMGRKIMAGDVIELPHRRDDALMTDASSGINRFFVVEEAKKSAGGYSSTWWPHIWRFKLVPMPASQEYKDILDASLKDPFGIKTDGTLRDAISTMAVDLGINEEIVRMAEEKVYKKNFETRQFWCVPGEETKGQNPWIYAGDGVPPNGAFLVGSGSSFPTTPADGDYYLRTDYAPHALFRYKAKAWRIQELDYRLERWDAAHRVLLGFVNNDRVNTFRDGSRVKEKQDLWQAIKPNADL